jgi:multicomponent Na+:H+ antiporter subunit D
VKSALFLLTGICLNRYGSVDELDLRGRVERGTWVPWLFLLGGLALSGLPPFGTGLGKALSEEAVSRAGFGWGLPFIVVVSAVTGGAVIRAALRIGWGLGPRRTQSSRATSGSTEGPEAPTGREATVLMRSVAAMLLAGGLAVGVLPGATQAISRASAVFTDHTGYLTTVLQGQATPALAGTGGWTASGVLFGFVSALLAVGCAAVSLFGERLPELVRAAGRGAQPALGTMRRLHSGHIGDYVAFLLVGVFGLTLLLGVPLG